MSNLPVALREAKGSQQILLKLDMISDNKLIDFFYIHMFLVSGVCLSLFYLSYPDRYFKKLLHHPKELSNKGSCFDQGCLRHDDSCTTNLGKFRCNAVVVVQIISVCITVDCHRFRPQVW